jgi:transposase
MNRIIDFEITEKEEDLKNLLLNEKDIRVKERLQVIYLIKTKEVTKISKLSKIIIRDRGTIRIWIKKYQESGLSGLLKRDTSLGRPSALKKEEISKLNEKLSESVGFKSYIEIQNWIAEKLGVKMKYKAVFKLCHNKLGASPKVSRPMNPKQDIEKAETFKKKPLKKK